MRLTKISPSRKYSKKKDIRLRFIWPECSWHRVCSASSNAFYFKLLLRYVRTLWLRIARRTSTAINKVRNFKLASPRKLAWFKKKKLGNDFDNEDMNKSISVERTIRVESLIIKAWSTKDMIKSKNKKLHSEARITFASRRRRNNWWISRGQA